MQGVQKESILPAEEWQKITAKLNRYGGLYVYRDGVRVLPYGNSDYDFLNIERRRTKKASDWYFSYRRLFGAVEITRENNGKLEEKAGREGFRENAAYRQFRAMLENFFKQLALDWFREQTSVYGNFKGQRDEFKRQAEVLERREKQILVKRKRLQERIDQFFDEVEGGTPARIAGEIRRTMDELLQNIGSLQPEDAAKEIVMLEVQVNEDVDNLRERFRVPKPRGFSPTKSLQKELDRVSNVTARLENEIFGPLSTEIDERISAAADEARALVSRHQRIKEAINSVEARETRRARTVARETQQETTNLSNEVFRRTKESLVAVDKSFKEAAMSLARESLADLSDDKFRDFGLELEERLKSAVMGEIESLEQMRDQIQSLIEAIKEGVSLDETTAAYEERSQILEEQLENYTELAQLGTAIGIIQHEFNSTVGGLSKGIQDLTSWSKSDPQVKRICTSLRSSFEHLETYLSMFQPLRKRLYRKAITISGKAVRTYLLQIFGERFKRHRIEWKTSDAFEGHTVEDYPSVFLPPFVNIVDNGLYWLTRDSSGRLLDYSGSRQIMFDADDTGFLISNSGPGIDEKDADRIFEFSFTRKLRGLGMGLAIARKALRDAGYDLTLETTGRGTSPIFRVSTVRNKTATQPQNTSILEL